VKFLLDQDVYALTERFLRGLGYDIVTAAELGLSRAADVDLLKTAGNKNASLSRVTGIMAISYLCMAKEAGLSICGFCHLHWMTSMLS